MLIKFPAKTRYLFNIVLPFVLLFQGTLPTIGKQIYIQTNFAELIYDTCKDPGHSHPPLSQRETSNEPVKCGFNCLLLILGITYSLCSWDSRPGYFTP